MRSYFYSTKRIVAVWLCFLALNAAYAAVDVAVQPSTYTIAAWGDDYGGKSSVPNGLTGYTAVAAGGSHTLAIKPDGTVVAWGENANGECTIPSGLGGVVAIAAGDTHSLALKSDGTVVAWGYFGYPATGIPNGLSSVVAIAADANHSLALKSDGTVAAWGVDTGGVTDVPSGLSGVTAIVTGNSHSLALESNGTVVAWGNDTNGQIDVPSGLKGVVAIAAGAYHSLALKSDGTVVAWGNNNDGQTNVPNGLTGVVAIAAGDFFSMALKTDGTVVAWGSNSSGQTSLPTGLTGVVAISASDDHAVVLYSGSAPGSPTSTAIAASAVDALDFNANWTAADASNTYNYSLLVSTTPDFTGNSTTFYSNTNDLTTFQVTGLSPSTTYYYRVLAAVFSGSTPYSNVISVTTPAFGPFNPPVAEAASFSLASNFTANWEPVQYATNYTLNISTAPDFSSNVSTYQTGNVTNYTITGLSPGTQYYYEVQATGQPGTSGFSSVISVFTTVGAIANPLFIPAGQTSTLTANSGIAGTSYQWYQGKSGDTSNPISGATSSSYTTPPLAQTTAYWVKVTYASSATSNSATIRVNVQPTNLMIAAWGDDSFGDSSLPSGLANYVSITAGYFFSLALKPDGTVVGWGDNSNNELNMPSGLSGVVAVAATGYNALALKADGTVVSWGENANGNARVPTGLSGVVAIAAGNSYLALKEDGTVVAWGDNSDGELTVPTGLTGVVAIAANGDHDLALESDGTVVAWGSDSNLTSPLSGVVAIAAGGGHSLALKSDGTVVAWGNDNDGQTNVPAGLTGVVAIAAGDASSFAIKADGTVVAWGATDDHNPIPMPSSLSGVVSMASNGYHYTALQTVGSPPVQTALPTPTNVQTTAIAPLNFTSNWAAVGSANSYVLLVAPTPDFNKNVSYNQLGNVTNYTVTGLSAATIYYYRVQAIGPNVNNQPDNSDYSGVISVTTSAFGPFGPPVVNATNNVSLTGFTANWAALQYASNYTLSVSPTSDFSSNVTTYPTGNVTSYAVTGLAPGTEYYYEVNAVGLPGTSANSAPVSVFTTAGSAANPYLVSSGHPATLTAVASGTGLTYQWYQGNSGDTSQPIAGATAASYTTAPLTQSASFWVQVTNAATVLNSQTVTVMVQTINLADLTNLKIAAWGDDNSGESSVPNGLEGYVAVAASYVTTYGLKTDGTVDVWGDNGDGEANVPSGLSGVTAIAAGLSHCLALKSDGTVVAWGDDSSGQIDVPQGLAGVVAIAGGGSHSLALKSDGTVVAWGDNGDGESVVPSGLSGVTAIAAGSRYSMAVKLDGTVVVWGYNDYGIMNVPSGLSSVVAVAAGDYHSLALKSDGTVVVWGSDGVGQVEMPSGLNNVVAIAAGSAHSLALESDGTLVAWGSENNEQVVVPSGLSGVVAIAANSNHDVVLTQAANSTTQTGASVPVLEPASAVGPIGFTVNWTASSGANDYTLLVSTSPDFNDGVTDSFDAGNVTSYPLANLSANTTYYYRVRANDIGYFTASSFSDFSSAASATTTPFGPFGPPTMEAASFVTPHSFTANWDALQYATSYTLSVSTTPDFSAAVSTYGAGNFTNLVVAGLAPGTQYFYKIQATGLPGTSGFSTTESVVTNDLAEANTHFVTAGQTANLTVQASGTGLSYQWYQGASGDTSNPISGATTASYATLPLTQTASYWAQVTSNAGIVDSRTVTVNVQPSNLTIVAWGDDGDEESSVPNGLSGYAAVAAGTVHTLALKDDGTLVAWGSDGSGLSIASNVSSGESSGGSGVSGISSTTTVLGSLIALPSSGLSGASTNPASITLSVASAGTAALGTADGGNQPDASIPTSGVVAIAAGFDFNLALKTDGTVVGWGSDESGETDVPANLTSVVAIAAGEQFSLALKTDGTVVAWGNDSNGQTDVPAGLSDVVAIAAGDDFALAVKEDGTVVGWGDDDDGEIDIPAGLTEVVAVAAGGYHSLALRADGTVVAWGNDSDGQSDVPTGLAGVVAIAAGATHSLALKSDGTVAAWGSDGSGQIDVPTGLSGIVAIAASNSHSVALQQAGSPPAQTTEPAPTNITTSAFDATSFTAEWPSADQANDYNLAISTSADFSNGVTWVYDVGNVLNATASGLSPTTTYYYRIRAVGDSGTSVYSSVSIDTPPLPTQIAWTGSTSSGWGTGTNWSGGVVPNSPTTVANFTSTIGQGSVISLNGTISLGEIAFTDSNSAAFSITGNGLDLFGSISTPFSAIADDSNNRETIASNIAIEGAQQWLQSSASGNLVVSGNVDLGNEALTINVTNSTLISGSISDAGSLTKTGAGRLILSGNNHYTGSTTIAAGTLSSAGNLTINANASLLIGATGTLLQGNINLGGTTNLTVNSLTQHSQITVANLLNYGGNLSLNLGNSLSFGTYNLFSSHSRTGDFLSVAVTGLFSGVLSESAGVWSGMVSSDAFSFNDATGSLIVSQGNMPGFSTQPVSKTVAAGQVANFAVAAGGKPAPNYQWQREAAGTSVFVNLTNGGSYSGVTTATLSVNNTTVGMSGDQFLCVATNSAGNATTSPATLTVNKAGATLTLSNLTQTYSGTPRILTVTINPSGLAYNVTYNGSTTAPTIPGNYAVVATTTDPNHAGSASGTLVVNKSTAMVTLSNLSQTYTGSAKPVIVTTSPANLTVSVTYNGSATPPVNGGSYAVVASITDPFSSGNKTGTLTITKASQTITFEALPLEKVGNAPFALGATAASGLTVAYTSSNAAVATISGNMVNIVGKGTVTITASQPGNSNYNAATNVSQTLAVNLVPVFTTQPTNKTVTAGQTASFTVTANALPTPTYQGQPVVGSGRSIAGQWIGGGCVYGDAVRQLFHWPRDSGIRSAIGLECDAGFGRGGSRKRRVVHHRAEMDPWSLLPLLHGYARHRSGAGSVGDLAGAQTIQR